MCAHKGETMKKIKLLNCILNIIIVILFIILLIPSSNTKKDVVTNNDIKPDYVTNQIYDETMIEGIKITVSPVVNNNGNYNVEVTVLNEKDLTFNINGITLIIYDENNNKIKSISDFKSYSIPSSESVIYLISCDKDLIKEGYTIDYRLSYTIWSENNV